MSKSICIIIPGCFNPITNAHINMIKTVKNKYPDASIHVMPASDRYFQSQWKKYKVGDILPESARSTLCQDVIQKEFGFKANVRVNSINLTMFNKSTYEIVNHLKKCYGIIFDEFYICLGADNLKSLDTWTNAENFVKENKFIIITREGEKGDFPSSLERYAGNFEYLDGEADTQNVSSTQIREAYKNGNLKDYKDAIPAIVYNYLEVTENVFF